MQINTRSWHYRIINVLDFNHPRNLCPYCWKVLWSCFMVGAVIPVVAVVVVAAVTSPFWFWLQPYMGITVLGVTFGLLEAVILTAILRAVVRDRREDERREGTRAQLVTREPGLFWLWIKARHEDVCPLLQFVSKSNEN